MVTFPPKILANFSSQPQATSEKDDLIRIRFHKKATSKEDNLKGKRPYIRQICRQPHKNINAQTNKLTRRQHHRKTVSQENRLIKRHPEIVIRK